MENEKKFKTNEIDEVKHHLKTHTEHSDSDVAAVTVLQSFLRSNGKINTNFASNDKWPNTDGTFEFVSSPEITRQPEQSFFVQIKGTGNFKEEKGEVKYSLKSLAFPAFVYMEVTLDPSILFVVFNPKDRGKERVFWKYMSVDFLQSIDFSKESITIVFFPDDEIKNTDDSVETFCKKLSKICEHHTFIKRLDNKFITESEVMKIIEVCDEDITEKIERLDIFNENRDSVSKKMLNRMYDICAATLLLNSFGFGFSLANLQMAYEQAMLNIETKYLADFMKGIKYVGNRIPHEGQSERLLLKYYDFLWQIRRFLKFKHDIDILHNLEIFPIEIDKVDKEFYSMVSSAIENKPINKSSLRYSRYYIQKRTPFFIGSERYYEITLQLAEVYATKYNRLTVFSKENISTGYSIRIGYEERSIKLWDVETKIKVVTNWEVSIAPACLNKLAKALYFNTKISSKHGEYISLMKFLTSNGMSFLELIDLGNELFINLVNAIFEKTNTSYLKEVLTLLHNKYSKTSIKKGKNVIRYLLINLREDDFDSILPDRFTKKYLAEDLYIASKSFPFEKRPFISNLAGSKTSNSNSLGKIVEVAGFQEFSLMRPYVLLRNATRETGEIYFEDNSIIAAEDIDIFNNRLDEWEKKQGYGINQDKGMVCIDSYEKTTIFILERLLELSKSGNAGQEAYNRNFVEKNKILFEDPLKELAIRSAFVNSKLMIIYGAAGTGKTLLINYLSNLMSNKRKLFLTKTHTARQNLQRRIENPGSQSEFISIDSLQKKYVLKNMM